MSKTNVIKDGRIYVKAFSGKPGESYKIKYRDGSILETKIRVEEFKTNPDELKDKRGHFRASMANRY
jgi:hypothetical protein